VAAIVYRRRKHTINLFVWPSSPADGAMPVRASRQGFHMLGWTDSGMTFGAVSDLNEAELQEFVRLIRDR
jgi:anti-sigma factor RsiW